MPILRTYQCPDCEGLFEHLHMHREEDPPSFCPLCGSSTSAEPQLSAPHIGRPIGQAADGVYRAMEQASEQHAAQAAEMLGVSASETSGMKMTDLRDNARVGEASVPVSVNGLSGNHRPQAEVMEFARSAHNGPDARAGIRAIDTVRSLHHRLGAASVARSTMGKAE